MKKFLSTLLTLSMVLTMLATGAAIAASDEVQADADALTLDDILSVPSWNGNTLIDNLDIDIYTKGEVNESPIVWSSTNEAVISTSGIVTRGAEDAEVTVTATIGTDDNAVTKDFTFVVPAASKTINGIPTVGSRVLYEDNFSGEAINSKITTSCSGDDYVTQENGKLTLYANTPNLEPHISINFNNEVNGNLITTFEFSLHTTSAYVRIPFVGYNWNGYPAYIHWYTNDNQISIGKSQTKDVSRRISLPKSAKGKKAKFIVSFNNPKATYDLWVNNELVLVNQPYGLKDDVNPSQKPYMLRISTATADWVYGIGKYSLDNVKVYESVQSDSLLTLTNVEKIFANNSYTENGKSYINNAIFDLSYVKGENDASVNYNVSDTSVISETGDITRALTDKEITITATINSVDGGQLVKNFKFIVPGKYNKIGTTNIPSKGTSIINERFNGAELTTLVDKQISICDTATLTQSNGILTHSKNNNASSGFRLKQDNQVKKGIVCQELYFDSSSDNLRISIVNDGAWNAAIGRIAYRGKYFYVLGNGSWSAASEKTYSGIIRLTIVTDITNKIFNVYANGDLIAENIGMIKQSGSSPYAVYGITFEHMYATVVNGWGGGNGTTNLYNFEVYNVAEGALPDAMAGEYNFSNNGTVVSGSNSVAIPVIATSEAGERDAMLIYAIYSEINNVKKLVGVDVKPINLDQYSHNEYTATVNVSSVPEMVSQKAFILSTSGDIKPLSFDAFPAQ